MEIVEQPLQICLTGPLSTAQLQTTDKKQDIFGPLVTGQLQRVRLDGAGSVPRQFCLNTCINFSKLWNIKMKKQNCKAKLVNDNATKKYINDPYFIVKREIAAEFLRKAGLPQLFTKQQNK
jgi:hypothetical protein